MTSSQMPTDTDTNTVRTQQATRSCKLCHEKKIKCDLSGSGSCSRCTENGIVCERRTRKAYAPRKRRAKSSSSATLDTAITARRNDQIDNVHTKAFAEAVVNSRLQPERDNSDHVFVGDQQGIGSLLDVTGPNRQNHVQHLLGQSPFLCCIIADPS